MKNIFKGLSRKRVNDTYILTLTDANKAASVVEAIRQWFAGHEELDNGRGFHVKTMASPYLGIQCSPECLEQVKVHFTADIQAAQVLSMKAQKGPTP